MIVLKFKQFYFVGNSFSACHSVIPVKNFTLGLKVRVYEDYKYLLKNVLIKGFF